MNCVCPHQATSTGLIRNGWDSHCKIHGHERPSFTDMEFILGQITQGLGAAKDVPMGSPPSPEEKDSLDWIAI